MPPTSPPRGATPGACASSTSRPTTASARSLGSTPRARRPSKRRSAVLDLRLIREQPEAVERALAGKGGAEHVKDIVAHDTTRRRLLKEAEDLKALRNRASEAIGQAKKRGEDASADMARMREVGERIKALDEAGEDGDAPIEARLIQNPNPPPSPVPAALGEDGHVHALRQDTPPGF